MKCVKLFLIIAMSGCVVIPTYSAKISLKPTIEMPVKDPVQNILLIGSGTVASRVFFENLSQEFQKSNAMKKIKTSFVYVGKSHKTASFLIDSLQGKNYDACLLFQSGNNEALEMTKAKYIAVVGPGVSSTGYGNRYAEIFLVTLYNKKEKLSTLWQGDLFVDFDLANNSRYKEISNLFLKEFEKWGVMSR